MKQNGKPGPPHSLGAASSFKRSICFSLRLNDATVRATEMECIQECSSVKDCNVWDFAATLWDSIAFRGFPTKGSRHLKKKKRSWKAIDCFQWSSWLRTVGHAPMRLGMTSSCTLVSTYGSRNICWCRSISSSDSWAAGQVRKYANYGMKSAGIHKWTGTRKIKRSSRSNDRRCSDYVFLPLFISGTWRSKSM